MKKKKRWKIALGIVGGLIVIAVIVGLGFSNYVGKLVADGILHQNDQNDTKANSLGQLEKWNYDLDKFRELYSETAITFSAEDGNEVPAVILVPKEEGALKNAQEQKKVAILVHGAGGEHVSTYPVAEVYLEDGYEVIAIDQRASGDSKNEWVSFGYFESLDVKATVDYAKNTMNANQVVVHGQSMGGLTVAVYSSEQHAAENVDAFVLDSAINGMEYVFHGMMMEEDGMTETSVAYIIACGDWYLQQHYGFGFDDLDAVSHLEQNQVPTLILYATQDDLVPEYQANEMFHAIAAEQKELVTFPCGHIESIIEYKKESSDAIKLFVEELE